MAWVNKIQALGEVKEIKYSQTKKGDRVVNFILTVKEPLKDKLHFEFFECSLFGRVVNDFEKHIDNGSNVYIEGKQRTKQGRVGVMIDSIQFL